ncbi:MAG: carbohydrate binding domain-containing protein [Planctomycetota bacterium]|nr:carbohydrate binding domain-containing protein [Planctomycetota bacterium]
MPHTTLIVAALCMQSGNLVDNGSFTDTLLHWTVDGDAVVSNRGYDGSAGLTLVPAPGVTAQAVQRIEGLQPQQRYTVMAKVRTTNRLCPPILAVRNGAQIDKACGYTSIEEEGRWVEERFEFFTDADSTAVDLVLQAWKTDEDAVVDIDEVRLRLGRQPAPAPEPWQEPFAGPPSVTVQPRPGDELVGNGAFTGVTASPWVPGIGAEVLDTDAGSAMRLTSSEDTSRARQAIDLALPPNTSYRLSARAKVDPGVIASMYLVGSGDFIATTPIDSTDWTSVQLEFTTGDAWVSNLRLTIENWKNQPGAAWFTDLSMTASGEEWSPTTDRTPLPAAGFVETFQDGRLDRERWLISSKSWGGDNGGVSPLNCSLVHDTDNGIPITALRLQANGDLYQGPIEHEGRRTRVGAAIATRQYYASGRYEVRARVAPELGVVTAFWPFHYIDYYPGEDGHWHEPNPRRNTEIDWEFPTDLRGNEVEAEAAGLDPYEISFTNARSNSWGGQFGGEGGEHKGRRILRNAYGDIVDIAQDSRDGIYHDYAIEWHSGSDLGDNGDTRDEPGCVRWYFDDVLIDELYDVEFGQGNVPFRAARFWIGAWFPASGYLGETGWGGTPAFDETELLIASVSITPFEEPRDEWVPETVPNLAWATPDQYPEPLIAPPCPADLDGSGRVDVPDLLAVLTWWNSTNPIADIDGDGYVDTGDLLRVIGDWGPCPDR